MLKQIRVGGASYPAPRVESNHRNSRALIGLATVLLGLDMFDNSNEFWLQLSPSQV